MLLAGASSSPKLTQKEPQASQQNDSPSIEYDSQEYSFNPSDQSQSNAVQYELDPYIQFEYQPVPVSGPSSVAPQIVQFQPEVSSVEIQPKNKAQRPSPTKSSSNKLQTTSGKTASVSPPQKFVQDQSTSIKTVSTPIKTIAQSRPDPYASVQSAQTATTLESTKSNQFQPIFQTVPVQSVAQTTVTKSISQSRPQHPFATIFQPGTAATPTKSASANGYNFESIFQTVPVQSVTASAMPKLPSQSRPQHPFASILQSVPVQSVTASALTKSVQLRPNSLSSVEFQRFPVKPGTVSVPTKSLQLIPVPVQQSTKPAPAPAQNGSFQWFNLENPFQKLFRW